MYFHGHDQLVSLLVLVIKIYFVLGFSMMVFNSQCGQRSFV